MMRDELVRQLSALPADTDISIQVGSDRLDIADLAPWGDGGRVALKCHPSDFRDVLVDWGIPKAQQQWIAFEERTTNGPPDALILVADADR